MMCTCALQKWQISWPPSQEEQHTFLLAGTKTIPFPLLQCTYRKHPKNLYISTRARTHMQAVVSDYTHTRTHMYTHHTYMYTTPHIHVHHMCTHHTHAHIHVHHTHTHTHTTHTHTHTHTPHTHTDTALTSTKHLPLFYFSSKDTKLQWPWLLRRSRTSNEANEVTDWPIRFTEH